MLLILYILNYPTHYEKIFRIFYGASVQFSRGLGRHRRNRFGHYLKSNAEDSPRQCEGRPRQGRGEARLYLQQHADGERKDAGVF